MDGRGCVSGAVRAVGAVPREAGAVVLREEAVGQAVAAVVPREAVVVTVPRVGYEVPLGSKLPTLLTQLTPLLSLPRVPHLVPLTALALQ